MLKWILRLGINRGLMGGNRFLGTLGMVAALLRLAQRVSGGGDKPIYTHKLKEGEVLVVTDEKSPR